jgi:UDP-N-acetylglucosamine diphosphorylase/glucosamine-1-phosphate N-acetyltransferase
MPQAKLTLVFFDDSHADNFYPLSLSHCTGELRCGALTLTEKWSKRISHSGLSYLTRPHLASLVSKRLDCKSNEVNTSAKTNLLFINPRFLPNSAVAGKLVNLDGEGAFYTGDELVAVKVGSPNKLLSELKRLLKSDFKPSEAAGSLAEHAKKLHRTDIKVTGVKYLWDLVMLNGKQISEDFQFLRPQLDFKKMFELSEVDDDALIYNLEDVYISPGARLDGQVVLDARGGPIYLGESARIAAHTRVEGPAYIGDGCQLVGGRIRDGCSFGPNCRVGGEVEESIFLGYDNKYHDGFIGHAYVGEWVNFGAMTTNSDLKNNYANIKVELPSGLIDTGLNKVGSLVGDHTKTGIGTLLTTGMVLGFSVNLFGGGLAGGRHLPSFVWGGKDGFVEYQKAKALATAKVVMGRRDQHFGKEDGTLFDYLFATTEADRKPFLTGAG